LVTGVQTCALPILVVRHVGVRGQPSGSTAAERIIECLRQDGGSGRRRMRAVAGISGMAAGFGGDRCLSKSVRGQNGDHEQNEKWARHDRAAHGGLAFVAEKGEWRLSTP